MTGLTKHELNVSRKSLLGAAECIRNALWQGEAWVVSPEEFQLLEDMDEIFQVIFNFEIREITENQFGTDLELPENLRLEVSNIRDYIKNGGWNTVRPFAHSCQLLAFLGSTLIVLRNLRKSDPYNREAAERTAKLLEILSRVVRP